jgi:hypothetical protein
MSNEMPKGPDEGHEPDEVAEYVPTARELVQLVKYWYGEILNIGWLYFTTGDLHKSWVNTTHLASRRLDRLAAVIGQETVDQEIKQVDEQFEASVGAKLWNIFLDGDAEEWAAVQDVIGRQGKARQKLREGEALYRSEEWAAVQEATLRKRGAAEVLNRLEELEKQFPGDFIALLLFEDVGDKDRVALITLAESELTAILGASGKFQIVTDQSKVRALLANQEFARRGFLWGRLRDGAWEIDFLDASPGTLRFGFLKSVASEIRTIVHAATMKKPE